VSLWRRCLKTGLVYLRGGRPLKWYVKRGLRIGDRPKLHHPFSFDPSHCWLIDIGDDVEFSRDVHILAHDASTMASLGVARIGRVRVGDRVFLGYGTVILPGATIGADVIIGAGSVVASDIPPNSVAVGNPARVVSSLDDYLRRQRELMDTRPIFGEDWTDRGSIGPSKKEAMRAALEQAPGFVR
jgi:maltose O-acetyltransferase